MSLQNNSNTKNTRDSKSSTNSESTEEPNVPSTGVAFLHGQYLQGLVAFLSLILAAVQTYLENTNYSLGACLFCIVLATAIIGWGFYILNKYHTEKKVISSKLKKTLNSSLKNKLIHREKRLDSKILIVHCSMIFSLSIILMPVVLTLGKAFPYVLTEAFPTVSEATEAELYKGDERQNKNESIKESSTPVSTPIPSFNTLPTFTPIPIDESQNSFDILWDVYFEDFCSQKYANGTQAINKAQEYIDTWNQNYIYPITEWDFEQMDVYYTKPYEQCEASENILKSSQSLKQIWVAAESYLIGTKRQIDSGKVLQERDFGLTTLRGINLFLMYLNNCTSSNIKGNAYNSVAILLRQCGDYLYSQNIFQGKQRQLAMYAFACAFYYKAQENNFISPSLKSDIQDMQRSVEDTLYSN